MMFLVLYRAHLNKLVGFSQSRDWLRVGQHECIQFAFYREEARRY
jgi:hypothetical protein